jgi:5-hydroxyisourate hydrolase-like protein (transthyretin family)
MSIDINVYLRSKGGKTTRAQAKLSTKETHKNKKGRTSASASKKEVNHMGALATFMASGNFLKSSVMKIPVLRSVMVAGKTADKAVNFGVAIYQARSGEQMLSNNIKAYSKVATTLGLAYVEGAIDNWLYREPTVQRQNYMLDYGRKLYTQNIENEKNQLS